MINIKRSFEISSGYSMTLIQTTPILYQIKYDFWMKSTTSAIIKAHIVMVIHCYRVRCEWWWILRVRGPLGWMQTHGAGGARHEDRWKVKLFTSPGTVWIVRTANENFRSTDAVRTYYCCMFLIYINSLSYFFV